MPLWRLRRYDRLLWAIIASLLLQLAVVYLPVVNDVFHTVPLAEDNSSSFLSLLPLMINELWKYMQQHLGLGREVCDIGDA